MKVSFSIAKEMILETLRARLVPMLEGSPGGGKSALIREIAEENGLKVIDLRLAQCDPTDLLGFPGVNERTGRALYRPLNTFPLEGDEIPSGYNGWLLFLDEFNSAKESVQAAAYKLVLDKMVGEHRLHKNVFLACAGNLATDNAIVEEMSTAMQSRLIHLELEPDYLQWVDWAQKAGIDHRITDYIKFSPDSLNSFKPDHTDKTYACGRTWEFAHRFIADRPVIDLERLPLLAGTLSEGVARQFIAFCKFYLELPTREALLKNPDTVEVPTEPSIRYALTGSISKYATVENMDTLMKFIVRLPIEFQVITLRESIYRKPELKTTRSVKDWFSSTATAYFQ